MPNAWEQLHGLDPAAANNNADFDADGYTDLEEYINELAAWPASAPVVFKGAASTRYAVITNWNLAANFNNTGHERRRATGSRASTTSRRCGPARRWSTRSASTRASCRSPAPPAGNATLNVTGGWIDVADSLHVGTFTTFDPAGNELVNAGTGVVTQTGGAVLVANAVAPRRPGVAGAAGTYNLQGGTLVATAISPPATGGTFNFTGGTLSVGTFAGNLTQAGGTLAPGSPLGTTTITGDYAITNPAAAVSIDIAGTTPGTQFDRIDVAGTATLGGVLRPQLGVGARPPRRRTRSRS